MKKLGIWLLALTLLLAHLFFRSVAHAEEIRTQGGECTIDFPVSPQKLQKSLPLSERGEELRYDMYLAPFQDQGVFLLLIATYPAAFSSEQEIVGLEGLLQSIVGRSPDHVLLFADVMDVQGHRAINFLIESKTSFFRGRALIVENKLFLIAMEGKREAMQESVFTRFVKSFQLK